MAPISEEGILTTLPRIINTSSQKSVDGLRPKLKQNHIPFSSQGWEVKSPEAGCGGLRVKGGRECG
jgi:hypothetical protein